MKIAVVGAINYDHITTFNGEEKEGLGGILYNVLALSNVTKRHNLPFIFHSDGKLWHILDDLIECGVNAIHPLEPLSLVATQLKKEYGDKLCLIGNVDLDYPLTRGTPEDVRRMVKERIEKLAQGGGYCCGSSNTIANYVPVENYIALLEATEEYGRYPIR